MPLKGWGRSATSWTERVAAETNIMKQEKEAEVKEREVKVRGKLDANIRKQAEAENI